MRTRSVSPILIAAFSGSPGCSSGSGDQLQTAIPPVRLRDWALEFDDNGDDRKNLYSVCSQDYTPAQLAAAFEQPDAFWIHPVPRRMDDPLRRAIRDRWEGYGNAAPLVSCIMPTRNRREFVPRAIRQFQRQDWPNAELSFSTQSSRTLIFANVSVPGPPEQWLTPGIMNRRTASDVFLAPRAFTTLS